MDTATNIMDHNNLTCNMSNYNTTVNCDIDLPIIIGLILYSIICVSGIIENSLVIYLFLRFPREVKSLPPNFYFLNLAIADECVLIGIPFLVTTISLHKWIFSMFMYKVYIVTTTVSQFASTISLLIISVDRFIAVYYPNMRYFRSYFFSKRVALSAWAISFLITLPVFLHADVENPNFNCNIIWPILGNISDHGSQTAFIFYTFFLGFVIPLIVILISYILVIIKLPTIGPKNSNRTKEKYRKGIRRTLTVITMYIFCLLPYWITQLIFTLSRLCETNITASFLITGLFSFFNSVMNPIFYTFLSEDYQKSLEATGISQFINKNIFA